MPFLNGVKVTNDEWVAAKSGQPVGWKEAFGYNDGSEPEAADETAVEEPKKRKPRNKKAETEAALAQVTGLDITLDEGEETENDTDDAAE